ncbi:MAG: DNA repair helicase [Thaumarchaeota archaeon]|nr:DNA repair helicase [Nitrososphaerota archaeon]
MALRDIGLKQEYRSDRDDIVHGFFVRCLASSVSYDRSIEHASVKSLTTLALSSTHAGMRLRIVSGNRFRASDIATLTRLFSEKGDARGGAGIREGKLAAMREMIREGRPQIKVAIPSSEDIVGAFTERIGIFTDEAGDIVAFTGTSNRTFDAQNLDFESIDVFTSWEDASRVETKVRDFGKLWANETRYLSVFDFARAESENLLKYSSSWAVSLE